MKKVKEEIYSDYWLDEVLYQEEESNSAINTDLIKLAASRRLVSNFVNILTGKSIIVNFSDTKLGSGMSFTDGNRIWLSADIEKRKDFDVAVGLSLHEGSHILLTDFNLAKTLWQKVPRYLYDIAEPKLIFKETVADILQIMFNYVEDRYIDFYIYKTSPGYRGYYSALYDKFYNNKIIDDLLKSSDFRELDISSYKYRIINLTNENTDLNALPGLKQIWDVIYLKNIQRLSTTQDRFDIACKISEIILNNITNNAVASPTKQDESGGDELLKPFDDISGNTPIPNTSSPLPSTTDDTSKPSDLKPLSPAKREKAIKALEKQKDFLSGNVKKKKLIKKDKRLLDLIEKNNITISIVGKDYDTSEASDKVGGVDCIFVKNLTKELIADDTFPLSDHNVFKIKTEEDTENTLAVKRGITLGTLLGSKLQIRNEENYTKFLRRTTGKLEKRTLFELGWDSDSIFSSHYVDKYKNINIHLSVDASSSMRNKKWTTTMTAVVAICKAASMINNINVSVTFRTTAIGGHSLKSQLPYVVLAYDSQKDKFTKIVNLFPCLIPSGFTPEGLAFEAIIDNIQNPDPDSLYYFINFSDGEPFMHYSVGELYYTYRNEKAAAHTHRQVTKIKNKGYEILSYFIKEKNYNYEPYSDNGDTLVRQFKKMYGENASFVGVESVINLTKTLNELFLRKYK